MMGSNLGGVADFQLDDRTHMQPKMDILKSHMKVPKDGRKQSENYLNSKKKKHNAFCMTERLSFYTIKFETVLFCYGSLFPISA